MMLSRNLEKSLHRALACASERRQEYATLEHLLLALTEDQDAVAVLRACGVDIDQLRRELLSYVDNEPGNLVFAHVDEAKATASFQRVIQRAAIHVQSSGRKEVTSGNILVAMFAERESQAVSLLHEQDMTRFDAVNYITHGIAKLPRLSETRPVQREAERTQDAFGSASLEASRDEAEGVRLQNEDRTIEVEGRVAHRRVRADDHVKVTLLEPPTGSPDGRPIRRLTVTAERALPVIGTYLLAYDHADFWRLFKTLSGAGDQGWTVRLSVDPNSHLIRSVAVVSSLFPLC
jgi:hypothetical protein